MKKIPTLFIRDFAGDPKRVLPEVTPGCEWVIAGEGIAMRKLDGTCCLVRGGKLFKRRELKKGDTAPPDFEAIGTDNETGKTVGWVPVGDGPDDKWHRAAFAIRDYTDGTYELLGPKIQGNSEDENCHVLVAHDGLMMDDEMEPPRTFDGLAAFLACKDIEGIVWHHPDGRMAKIKLKDFGLERGR